MIPPSLPLPPDRYDVGYFLRLLSTLSLYFNALGSVRQWTIAKLNIDLATLPTEADVATLRAGDVYRDTTADNALKVKV